MLGPHGQNALPWVLGQGHAILQASRVFVEHRCWPDFSLAQLAPEAPARSSSSHLPFVWASTGRWGNPGGLVGGPVALWSRVVLAGDSSPGRFQEFTR